MHIFDEINFNLFKISMEKTQLIAWSLIKHIKNFEYKQMRQALSQKKRSIGQILFFTTPDSTIHCIA